jgi:hypothetical protein
VALQPLTQLPLTQLPLTQLPLPPVAGPAAGENRSAAHAGQSHPSMTIEETSNAFR